MHLHVHAEMHPQLYPKHGYFFEIRGIYGHLLRLIRAAKKPATQQSLPRCPWVAARAIRLGSRVCSGWHKAKARTNSCQHPRNKCDQAVHQNAGRPSLLNICSMCCVMKPYTLAKRNQTSQFAISCTLRCLLLLLQCHQRLSCARACTGVQRNASVPQVRDALRAVLRYPAHREGVATKNTRARLSHMGEGQVPCTAVAGCCLGSFFCTNRLTVLTSTCIQQHLHAL